jgi:hypothetical protein
LMCWCGLIPWLHSCLGWCSGAVLIMPLFYWTVLIDTGWLNFIKVPVILIVCLVLLHTLFYFVILHADIDSPVPAWHISELLWTWGFLNCPENAVCHGWWETYIVCITCHMSILLVWLCGFWIVMEGLCWQVFTVLRDLPLGWKAVWLLGKVPVLHESSRWTSLLYSFASSKMFAQCVVRMMLHFRAIFLCGLASDLYV